MQGRNQLSINCYLQPGSDYKELDVHLRRMESGFGFRILGGDEPGQPVSWFLTILHCWVSVTVGNIYLDNGCSEVAFLNEFTCRRKQVSWVISVSIYKLSLWVSLYYVTESISSGFIFFFLTSFKKMLIYKLLQVGLTTKRHHRASTFSKKVNIRHGYTALEKGLLENYTDVGILSCVAALCLSLVLENRQRASWDSVAFWNS